MTLLPARSKYAIAPAFVLAQVTQQDLCPDAQPRTTGYPNLPFDPRKTSHFYLNSAAYACRLLTGLSPAVTISPNAKSFGSES